MVNPLRRSRGTEIACRLAAMSALFGLLASWGPSLALAREVKVPESPNLRRGRGNRLSPGSL